AAGDPAAVRGAGGPGARAGGARRAGAAAVELHRRHQAPAGAAGPGVPRICGMTTAPPAAATSAEQRERRRRIIDAAFELGADRGYDAVQMRDVSASANVSLATIYRYFSSKDHLLAAAMTEWTAKLQARVAQSPPRGDSAADQLVDGLNRACRALARQ